MAIRIHNLRDPEFSDNLSPLVAEHLGVDPGDIRTIQVLKSSIDGRKHRAVRVWTLDVEVAQEDSVLARFKGSTQVLPAPPPKNDTWQGPTRELGSRPLVVGAGPAGLLTAWALAHKGYKPLLIDRGKPLRPRWKDVNAYWNQGELNPESNVVFGDGGAGTFSDGKLYTRRNDSRNTWILEFFARLAEAPDILTDGKPHLGTNRLSKALISLKKELLDMGVTMEFETKLESLKVEGGQLRGAVVNGRTVDTDAVFLATGHSARDVYKLLESCQVAMEARPMALGVRAEHPQEMINLAQWGTTSPDHGAADYMLAFNDSRGDRSAYTFCMCPGGEVVAAGTEVDGLTVNGMSYSHRADHFGNAAVVVTVQPDDYPGEGPLRGLEWQRQLERAAFNAGGGGHKAPAQRIVDFLAGRPSQGDIETSYRLGVTPGDVGQLLPQAVVTTMKRGLRHFGRRVRGYDGEWGVLIGLETRTTSPVRIVRDPESYESVTLKGLYPMGEGAGYAGGIMSSASDGLRAVERITAKT